MAMALATLEALVDGSWQRAATVELLEEDRGEAGRSFVEYEFDYLDRWLGAGRCDVVLSAGLPLEFGPTSGRTWPLFLDDVRRWAARGSGGCADSRCLTFPPATWRC